MRIKETSLFGYCCFLVLLCTTIAFAQTQIEPATTASTSVTTQIVLQSPEAKEMAEEIGIDALIARFNDLPAVKKCGNDWSEGLQALMIRQQISEAVLEASLETDHALGDIDNELMHIRMTRDILQSRQDHFSKVSNVAAIISAGTLGVIGTALQYKENTVNSGNAISIAGNGASVVLSLLGLRQLKRGERLSVNVPNMLAAPLGQEDAEENTLRLQTPVVWRYLSAVPPTEASPTETRLESLKNGWIERGLLEKVDSKHERNRIAQLTSTGAKQPKLSIDMLDARTSMLIDLHAQVSMMKHSMSTLMLEMKQSFLCGEN